MKKSKKTYNFQPEQCLNCKLIWGVNCPSYIGIPTKGNCPDYKDLYPNLKKNPSKPH